MHIVPVELKLWRRNIEKTGMKKADMEKHSIVNHECKNTGSVVVEATLIVPLFVFFAVALYQMHQCKYTETIIFEAAVETAEYMAEYAYLDKNNFFLPEITFDGYLDDKDMVEKYVDGGMAGISFLGSVPINGDGYVVLKVNYKVKLSIPLIGEHIADKKIKIMQKAYVGDDGNMPSEDDITENKYVFVTDNREAYHFSRDCSHLMLSVKISQLSKAKTGGYTPCELCGEKCEYGNNYGYVFVTDTGEKYHYSRKCSGLKRKVYRVRFKDVHGLPPCMRCGE